MLTNRGRWLLAAGISGALLGVVRGQQMLALLGLSFIVWMFFEWMLFRWRVEVQFRRLSCERLVNGSDRNNGTLWTGRAATVKLLIHMNGEVRLPFVRLEDVLPGNLHSVDDGHVIDTSILSEDSIEFQYTARPRGVGVIRFHGVSAQIADLQGLYYTQQFIPCRKEFRVLPTAVEVDATYPTVKRMNATPPPGIHRLKQNGMGAELLELREYVTGDPPKSIAWKASARRNTLMTRVYETEVPVRTTLFVDRSYGTQIGTFGDRPLDQTILMAASIAKSAMSVRDPVGLVVFDDKEARRIESGRGDRHYFRILETLSESVCEATPPPPYLSPNLQHLAWMTAMERYPRLMDERINRLSFLLFPILPHSRFQFKQRRQLAALMTELYDLRDDAPTRLTLEDKSMAAILQKFMIDEGFDWAVPVIASRSQEVHDWHGKFGTLTDALTEAVLRGKDNELYVLLIDLMNHSGSLGRMTKAIQMARARHHRVAVICPWPYGQRPGTDLYRTKVAMDDPSRLLQISEQARLNAAADRLKRRLRKLGVPVGFATDQRTLQMALTEAELARSGRLTQR